MYEHISQVRVRYAETDQMDIVYYGNYAQYFEVGRTESIRDLGFTYKEMEAMGVRMPVVELKARYLRPAHYDDLITIKTILKELPQGHSITFFNEVYNEKNKLLTTGEVTLYFINIETGKRTVIPHELQSKLAVYFPEDGLIL
ncbi:thioesterase family protein [Asinibacterium sp. OR53]|uniref:acyl-CoA thioesterase n=1 Tax=Asinibacterium sp. OR53 TaxID=925409 RepID=UPI00047877D0|nr:thioesterase family protein [Asinibacterium sp. OR53]